MSFPSLGFVEIKVTWSLPMSASSSPAPAMSSPRAAVSGAPDPRREGGKGGTPPPPAPAALAGDSPLSPPPPSGGEGGEAPCQFAVRRCIARRTNKCYLALARHPRSRGALTPCRAAETTQIQINTNTNKIQIHLQIQTWHRTPFSGSAVAQIQIRLLASCQTA